MSKDLNELDVQIISEALSNIEDYLMSEKFDTDPTDRIQRKIRRLTALMGSILYHPTSAWDNDLR